MKNERGFTLIEMMIVLLVISVLLIVTVPNIANHHSSINTKGCDAYVRMIEAQVQAFEMDNERLPENISDWFPKDIWQKDRKCHGDRPEIGVQEILHGSPNELGLPHRSLFVLSVSPIASLSLLFCARTTPIWKELFSQLKRIFPCDTALSTQRPITFNFDPANHYYYAKDYEGKILLERYYSKNIRAVEGSLKLSWVFNANGNMPEFGSIYFKIGTENYRLTFLIGRGRFYVVKE